ncbi:MAG: hypothetical protein H7323_00875 [Frankiales bacterium]|nr:hypothetical protein [Frankiales bacterium]
MTPFLLAAIRPLLLVVVATLALLGTGGVELAPRPATPVAVTVAAAASATTASRPTVPAARTDGSVPRAVLRAAVPVAAVPTVGGAALPPERAPHVAPHLVSAPQARPPTSPDLAAPRGGIHGRAPPTTTGT